MAELLRKEPDVEVELINGNHGEFTVSIDGRRVAEKKGDSLPGPERVLAALKKKEPVGAS